MFQDKIREIFSQLEDYVEYPDERNLIEFGVNGADINFDKLAELSNLLGTKNINFRSHQSNAGCDTCGYGKSYMYLVTVKEVNWHKSFIPKENSNA